MTPSPALIDALLDVQRRAQAAGHGGKEAVYAAACQRLGLTRPTLMRRLKAVTVRPERKRRSDAGRVELPLADARLLSAAMMEGYRANDKSIQKLRLTLRQLRQNFPLFAGVIDPETGQARQLSESACARALRAYALHPAQLRAPRPAQALASDHPNDVWQIDASISTLFYVPDGGAADMPPGEFYKNKPENFERIKRQRLTRYVITDHCSGAIFVHYVAGGESAVNMAEAFLAAIARRPGQEMFGVPWHLMMDPGSAGLGGAFKNLLRRLLVAPVVNQAGNPRAKGQVENAHNLVETNFESGFKFVHVPGIAWINAQAQLWMRWYNSVPRHRRHGMPRWNKWREITPGQLRLVDAELARQLLTHEPATPKVGADLTVRFAGRVWDVGGVDGVMVGAKIDITYNPFDRATAYVVQYGAEGNEQLLPVSEVQEDAHGFRAGAARIGREFKALPETIAVKNRKLVERLATGAATDGQAQAERKAKVLPFGGQIDPYKHLQNLPAAIPLAKRGTALDIGAQVAQAAPRPLTHFELARELTALGVTMNPNRVALLRAWYPQGALESDVPGIQRRLTVRANLRVVGGAANN